MLQMAILIFVLLLSACSPDPAQYKSETPALHPETFFNGELKSWGVFEDWRGQAVERFTMNATASWKGGKGRMDERFTFADGRASERHWTFVMTDAAHFIGTAPDVVGEAKGEVSGNALHWVYRIVLPVNGKDVTVRFDDWLYLVDGTHMFSVVKVSKFGLPVGRMTMFFEKPSP